MYTLESIAFMQNSIMDSFMFRICMYNFSFDKTYIYLEVYLILMNILVLIKNNFYDFHIFWWFELYCPIFMNVLLTWFLYTHFYVYSWLCFMSTFLSFIDFEWQLLCDIHVSWIYIYFYFLLEEFRTSF